LLAPAYPPDDVTAAFAQIIAHMAGRDFLEGVVGQFGGPILSNEPFEQVANHFPMGEEKLVRLIVLGHGPVPCARTERTGSWVPWRVTFLRDSARKWISA